MNYKRKRPQTQPAGCHMCKPWKYGHTPKSDRLPHSDRRRLEAVEATRAA